MASDLQFSIENISTLPQGKILALSGEVDETNQLKLESVLAEFMNDPQLQYLIINLKNLEYMNSGVIGLFALLHEQFLSHGKEFVFGGNVAIGNFFGGGR